MFSSLRCVSMSTSALTAGVAAATLTLGLTLSPAASAACASSRPAGTVAPARDIPFEYGDGPHAVPGRHTIVGLWYAEFLVGNGPDVYDRGFEQYHSDGTELMVDNAVAPSFGNVCVGVWEQEGLGTIKLRHVTWNWDDQGHTVGTFQLVVTVTVTSGGDGFEGRYVADSFDLSGAVIPDQHAEGKVHGRRIHVHD